MPQEPCNWDFFIAHAGADKSAAEKLYDLLVPTTKVFLDSRSLMLGDNWDQKLASAQHTSLVTIVLISAKTEQAYYQKEEIATAIDMVRQAEDQHRVVPVYLDAGARNNTEIPYGLRRTHGLLLAGAEDLQTAANRLLELLAKIKQKETAASSKASREKLSIQERFSQSPIEVVDETGRFRHRYLTLYLRLSAPSTIETFSYNLASSIPQLYIYLEDITVSLNINDFLPLTLDLKAYGRKLAETLFQNCIRSLLDQLIGESKAQNRGLRIRLRLDPPDLQSIYWETLGYPVSTPWLSAIAILLSRFVPTTVMPRQRTIPQLPLRLLVVIASPTNLNDYNLMRLGEREYQSLHSVLDEVPAVTVTYLESGTATPPTLERVYQALTNGIDIVHLLSHARNSGGRGTTVLFLERDDGTVDIVTTEELLSCFQSLYEPPQFCFLAGCETSRLGYQLVGQSGVAAAVAMNGFNSISTTNRFTSHLYRRLLQHGIVDLAVSEARGLVEDADDAHLPVLFSRLLDNILFMA
jgi:TIR domain/CHAT domain